MPSEATPIEIVRASTDLLYTALQDAYDSSRFRSLNLRESFIYRHARNISDLAEDCLCLAAAERWCSPKILTRSVIEGLFCMATAVERPEFAVEKIIVETDHNVRKLKTLQDAGDPNSWIEMISELEQFVAKLRSDYGVTTSRKWSVIDIAKAAGLEDDYISTYFMYCQNTHATVSGVIAQEHRSGVGFMLQTLAFAILRSVYYLVRGVPTAQGQDYVDRGAALIDRCSELVESSQFRMFRGPLWPS